MCTSYIAMKHYKNLQIALTGGFSRCIDAIDMYTDLLNNNN